jgi:hypothetical protein
MLGNPSAKVDQLESSILCQAKMENMVGEIKEEQYTGLLHHRHLLLIHGMRNPLLNSSLLFGLDSALVPVETGEEMVWLLEVYLQ